MSVRATNFVRGLRGLSPSEKAVAFVLADHDDHKGGGTFPGMLTVAEEAGLHERASASRITKRLVDRKIILTDNPSRGRKTTVYRFNFDLANRVSERTVENLQTVFHGTQLKTPNRVPTTPPTVFPEGPNRVPPNTGRVEGKGEGGCSRGGPNGNESDGSRRPTNTEALTDDEQLRKLLYEKFRPKFPGLELEHLNLAIVKIRDRATTPPGSLHFWFIAVEKFLVDYTWEHRASEKSLDLDRELRVGEGPKPQNAWSDLNRKQKGASS